METVGTHSTLVEKRLGWKVGMSEIKGVQHFERSVKRGEAVIKGSWGRK